MMNGGETFYYSDVNDLFNHGLRRRKKGKPYQPKEDNSETTAPKTKIGTAVTSSITAIVVVSIIAISVQIMTSAPLTINLSDWNITYRSIGFSFSGEKSDTPYIISIDLQNEILDQYEISDVQQAVKFNNLLSSTEYGVVIENDWGEGIKPIAEYQVKTRAEPTYPNGIFTISSHAIDRDNQILELNFSLDDPYHYLSDFRLELDDDIISIQQAIDDYQQPLYIDISGFRKGFLDIAVFGKSSHPSIGGEEILLTRYEIFN